MLWKEINSCEQCIINEEKICTGDWVSSPNGEPIEPPCLEFEDNTDLSEWVRKYYRYQTKYEDEKMLEEKRNRKKEETLKRKQQYLNNYCSKELYRVKQIKQLIENREKLVQTANDLAFAFNTTNEMFGYSEKMQVNPRLNNQLEILKEKLQVAENDLKEKQEKGRKTKEYLDIECALGELKRVEMK